MTQQEFFDLLNKHNAFLAPPSDLGRIRITNMNLQKMHAATIPKFLQDIYLACGGIKLGRGCIFGPSDIKSGIKYPTPDIFKINQELTNLTKMHGKTLFGRNDLFWFVFDAFGQCTMMDNVRLSILRKYDDPYHAILDCLIGGKL